MVEHWSPKPKVVGSIPAGPGALLLSRDVMVAPKGKEERARGRAGSGRGAELNQIARYFLELKSEWKKITFPDRKELTRSTIVVFIFTVLVTLVIATYDFLVSFVFGRIFG